MKLFFMLLFVMVPISAIAKQVTFGEKEVTIAIRYEVSDPKAGANPTYLRFPRAVSRVDNTTLFSVKASSPAGQQSDFRELEVRPRVREGSQKLEVLLDDGTVVRILARITDRPGTPTSYDFEPKRTLENPKESGSKAQISDLQTLRAVLQGELPSGMNRSGYNLPLNCKVSGVAGVLKKTFESDQFKIFQIELTNNSSKREFKIHEENIVFKGRDISRSPLIHLSARIISPYRKGTQSSLITILTDPSVRIGKISACDDGGQLEQLAKTAVKK